MMLSASVAVVGLWDVYAWLQGDERQRFAVLAQLSTALLSLLLGGGLWLSTRGGGDRLGRREAMLVVALGWLIGAAVAALPFFIWARLSDHIDPSHPFHSFVDCYFESMSGLTTTGATVLGTRPNDIESLPRGLLLWRASTHWIGGLGIVVLFVAVLPTLGVGGKKLFNFESTGPTKAGVKPRIRETARILWIIYLAMTAAQVVALLLCGMSLFDSICHTFATLGTGGFSTRNASIGDPQYGPATYIVITFFMVMAGCNFGLYYQLMRGRFATFLRDPELRLYLAILTVASIIVTVSILHLPIQTTDTAVIPSAGLGEAALHATFQVVSIQTTTGFCTADYNSWPFPAQATIIALMYIGGCAGSTGGGIKVIRVLIAFKVILATVQRTFRPHVVRPIKVGSAAIDPDLRLDTVVYILGIILLSATGACLLMMFEAGQEKGDMLTCFTASITTLNNVGPGLNLVGARDNYAAFTPASKGFMSLLMLVGRIEVYAIFVLFVPQFWRTY
jgi:trk system potassium uptake protein TrkH